MGKYEPHENAILAENLLQHQHVYSLLLKGESATINYTFPSLAERDTTSVKRHMKGMAEAVLVKYAREQIKNRDGLLETLKTEFIGE